MIGPWKLRLWWMFWSRKKFVRSVYAHPMIGGGWDGFEYSDCAALNGVIPMSKHTPGPWLTLAIERDCNEPEYGECYIVGDNLGGLVGAALPFPTERDNGDFSRVEANARLMAAAPDLLAALEIARGYVVDDIKRKPSEYDPSVDLASIDAAISKAKASNEVVDHD